MICPPRGGALFEAPALAAAFDALLPQSLHSDLGVWLGGQALLTSGPLLPQPDLAGQHSLDGGLIGVGTGGLEDLPEL